MAKVVPLANAKAFLDALEKSGLLGAIDLTSLRSSHGDDSDPRLVARDLVRENKLTRWQAGQLLHGFHQLMVGKYKLMDQLGTGEMGRVYLGEHAQLARKVSLKILSRKYTANPDILKKVLDDGRKASALDHRNLSHVFDVNSEDERYYLVTEFVEGKDLRQLVEASGATSPAQAMDIVRQAAEGLEHAHAQGVIHGDLKPSNLIIDASGVVKILDLGLARLTETAPAVVGDESTEVATLAAQSFHAPEQVGQHQVSPLVDIFSLGGILFYSLSGKPPLGNVKQAQDVKNACPAASDELAELCARMLSGDPVVRPQSARGVIEGLDAAARAKPKPAAKEEKKSSNGEKPQSKQKKPLVAKALEIPFPKQAAVATPAMEPPADKVEAFSLNGLNLEAAPPPATKDEPAAVEPAASEPAADDPFAGFSVQTKRKKQKPSSEPTTAPAPASTAEAPPTAAPDAPAKQRQKPSMTIVIVAGVGGGVLILALGVTVLLWVLSQGGKTAEKTAIAKAENKGSATAPAATEANPEANPEENPKVEIPNPATTTPEKTTVVPPMPNPGVTNPATTVNPPMPMPGVTPMPMPPATTTPAPMPPKPEPVKPMPMPEPAVPIGNPLADFPKVVPLPPLEEKGKAVADATKPFLLGAIKLPPKAICSISLKGGDNAISTNAKQKFVMEAANNGTAERDWDIRIETEGGGTPVLVAKLAIQNDQLNFQWTDEATKHVTSAPYLCNCVLTMKAGTGSHQLALRQPVVGAPMKVDLDKPMSARYTIEYPPNPKQIVIVLGPPEGKFPKFKFERPELTAKKDNTIFRTGTEDGAMLLHFRLDCAMSSKLLTIGAKAGYQIHGMTQPKPWLKNVAAQIVPATAQANAKAAEDLANLPKLKLDAEKNTAATTQLNKLVADTTQQKAEAVKLAALAKELDGNSGIHFHIFYEADTETRIVLVNTGAAPPMAPPP
ncbi:MAG: protein kinase domain-containing protein [Pirellulaceae bacterium]